MRLDRLLSVHDFERAALRRLPRILQNYVYAGTEDGATLRANRDAFARLALRPRGLTGVSARSQAVSLWGRDYDAPLGVSPMGALAICRYECDREIAAGAAAQKVPYILSGYSSVPVEQLQAAGLDVWYQGYLPGDVERIGALLKRLEAARVEVLVVTVDTAVGANREHNERAGFSIPFQFSARLLLDGILHPRWLASVFFKTLSRAGIPRFTNSSADPAGFRITEHPPGGFRNGRDALDWTHLEWIRAHWKGRIVLKGVIHPGDAERAVRLGLDGVMVSNHGGRQLECMQASLLALPHVVRAVPSDFPVFIDSGFRRGTDVFKALALGARMVFVGRPALYGAIVGGAAGTARVLSILKTELDRNMALSGCRVLAEVTSDLLVDDAGPIVPLVPLPGQG
ncbi:alpha-hydroxy acid oxidase [Achromobacter aloeverae]